MAIKVNGTTVIDDSRNLSNVGGLKTVNGTSILGSGNISAGASTTNGAVGTYAVLFDPGNLVDFGGTNAGSNFTKAVSIEKFATTSVSLSGTWRCMSYHPNEASYGGGLFVRIS